MAKLSARWTAIYFAGYVLTGNSRQFDAVIEYDELDLTAFQDGIKNAQPGLASGSVSAETFLNPASDLTHDALSTGRLGSYTDNQLLIFIGQNAAVAIGDPAFMMAVKQYNYQPNLQTAAAVLANVSFVAQTEPMWGIVLADTTITSTTMFATADSVRQAASSLGGEAILQVLLACATDTYVVTIQDSINDSAWTDLMAFSADASAIASERQTVAGNVDRYIRALATRTGAAGDNFKIAVAFKRYLPDAP
jgi:hypothetical protein